jgi:predicted GH43/DUF377 family glycosyl hydrolase
LKDGRILVVGHVGGDDEYGKVDQTIVQQTFRLEVAAAENAKAPTLTDLWDGKAAWVPDAEKIGASFDFHFPSIVPQPDGLSGFYIHNYTPADGRFKMSIGRARGSDGLHWTDEGKVIDVGAPGSWDDRIASFAGAWKDGDTWYLVYEGAGENVAASPGDIGLATSKDGKTWVKDPDNPILRHETTGWERTNIGTPSLFKEGDTWHLFYHGYDGNVCQIGVASGPDLKKLNKSSANPILPVTPGATAWDTGTTGHRSTIVKEGKYYYFAFEGSTPPPFQFSKWSSGLARTTALTGAWEKCPRNPLIAQTPGGMGFDGPELVRIGETWFLYVRTPASNTTQRFKLEARPAETPSE